MFSHEVPNPLSREIPDIFRHGCRRAGKFRNDSVGVIFSQKTPHLAQFFFIILPAMSPTSASIRAARAGVLPARAVREQYSKDVLAHPRRRIAPRRKIFVPPCVIKKQDCFAFLDEQKPGSADFVLTDPPYAISRETGFKNGGGVERFAVSMDFGEWDAAEIDLPRFASGIFRTLRKGGTAIVWYDLWKITTLSDALQKAGFSMLRVLVWEKTNPVPLNNKAFYLSNGREVAVAAVKGGKPFFDSNYDNGLVPA